VPLRNPGEQPADWTAAVTGPFIVADAGDVAGGETDQLIVAVAPNLKAGSYHGVLIIRSATGPVVIELSASVDTTAPEVIRITIQDSTCTDIPIELMVFAIDNVGVSVVVADWLHENTSAGSLVLTESGATYSGTISPNSSPGLVTLTATATDAAGNVGAGSTAFQVSICRRLGN